VQPCETGAKESCDPGSAGECDCDCSCARAAILTGNTSWHGRSLLFTYLETDATQGSSGASLRSGLPIGWENGQTGPTNHARLWTGRQGQGQRYSRGRSRKGSLWARVASARQPAPSSLQVTLYPSQRARHTGSATPGRSPALGRDGSAGPMPPRHISSSHPPADSIYREAHSHPPTALDRRHAPGDEATAP